MITLYIKGIIWLIWYDSRHILNVISYNISFGSISSPQRAVVVINYIIIRRRDSRSRTIFHNYNITIVNHSRASTTTCRVRRAARVADAGTRRHRWCSSLESTSRRFLFLNTDHRPPPRRPPHAGRAYKYWNDCDDVDAAADYDDGVYALRGTPRVFTARACSRTAVVVQHNTVSSVDGPTAKRAPHATTKRRTAAPPPTPPPTGRQLKNINLISWYFVSAAWRRCGCALQSCSSSELFQRTTNYLSTHTPPTRSPVRLQFLWYCYCFFIIMTSRCRITRSHTILCFEWMPMRRFWVSGWCLWLFTCGVSMVMTCLLFLVLRYGRTR